LDTASSTLPGDAWLAGQRVRYLVEAERFDEAISFGSTICRAKRFWCAALSGYAAHRASRFALADSLYDVALTQMDDDERCAWLDLSDLIDDDVAHDYDALDCSARVRFAERALRLGAPLYSVSGTDLLTEHLARVTRDRIAEHAATTYGDSWADDQRRITLRYGWPVWYTQSPPDPGSLREPSITGRDVAAPKDFLPTRRILDSLTRSTDDEWMIHDPLALTGYLPSYAWTFHSLTGQIAAFRRGDSALVVAAWNARRDTSLASHTLRAGLAVMSADGRTTNAVVDSSAADVGRIALTTPIDRGLLSLELLAPTERHAARMRVGFASPRGHTFALSDLLLYAPSSDAAYSLSDVRDSTLAGNTVSASHTVGVFWEIYGLDSPAVLHFSLTVEQVDIGAVRRLAERLHLTAKTSGLAMQWDEGPHLTNGIAARGAKVDVSALRPGHYRLALRVRTPHGETASAVRTIDVP
jgi:hypothetical protein